MTKKEEEPKKILTKYEKARLIGSRALQISSGAPFSREISKDELIKLKYSPLEIAKKEYEEGTIPIGIKRNLPTTLKKKKKEENSQEKEEETQKEE
ncbi:MAG: DNA-directed RNA polymerase subunit K [archaeon]